MYRENFQRIKIYTVAILVPLAVGIMATVLTHGSMDIYSELSTPPLSPPSWLFPVVWTILYILMGVSSAKIYLNRQNSTSKNFSDALGFYTLSLAFNFAWSIVFFNLRWFLFAFIWLLILFYLVIRTLLSYKKIDPKAAKLQIPYAIWVAFAGYLNFGIWILNG